MQNSDQYFTEMLRFEVRDELQRQGLKWGVQNHTQEEWLTILGEEVGEVARAILEKQPENYREELIQVAAVCMAAVENFDR
jgi:NTP pyrophosphatase (non-canonical NTP hydrolase)